ncbi:DNA ligase D [Cupriavidus sp. Marseille-Q8015]
MARTTSAAGSPPARPPRLPEPPAAPIPRPSANSRQKRDFGATPEPSGETARHTGRARRKRVQPLTFVVQKHAARRLHYDFRLELDGTLKSWAIPKGPSYDPADKRMAVHVEDHPLDYANFEGVIPAGHYGAGTVIVWDRGTWIPDEDPEAGYAAGKLKFELRGEKLQGHWTLVRMGGRRQRDQDAWLLIKERDDLARAAADFDVVEAMPDSVLAGTAVAQHRASGAVEGAVKGADQSAKAGAKQGAKKGAKKGAQAHEDQDDHKNGDGDDAPPRATRKKGAAARQASASRARAAKASGDTVAPPTGASKAALPLALAPQLATLVEAPPTDGEWQYEVKFDGYRLLARVDGDDVRLFTRQGHDWTSKLRSLAAEVRALGLPDGWLDGEIVVVDKHGVTDFQALQNAFETAHVDTIQYYVFDLPYYAGHDLRAVPLDQRRMLLRQVLAAKAAPRVRFSESFEADPDEMLSAACRMKLEGVIGKRVDSAYVSARARTWIKLKCTQRQEFVIGGFTDPKGSRSGLGALLLGVHDAQGKLRYVGNVGTGFDTATLDSLRKQLDALPADATPFADLPRGVKGHWVRPKLVAEVSFGAWTQDGRIRHSVFHGLRTDKPAGAVSVEKPVKPETMAGETGAKRAKTGAAGAKAGTRATASTAAKSGIAKSGIAKSGIAKSRTAKTRTSTAEASNVTKATTGTTSRTATRTARGARQTQATKETLVASAGNGNAGRIVVSHADRVIDASTGLTKGDLVRYYARAAGLLLPFLKGRPLAMVRAPAGIDGQQFFQRHGDTLNIDGMKQLDPELWPGHPPLIELTSEAAIVAVAQLNVVEFHTWNARARTIDKPDRIVFDIDPGEGVDWPRIQEAAGLVRAMLDALGLQAYLKTSGGKGLHVVVPIAARAGWDDVRDFAQDVVRHMAKTIPDRFVAKSGPRNRVGKIFIDYLRNGVGATTASAYSARARPGLGVSMPVSWDELEDLTSAAHWTIANVDARLDEMTRHDPWAGHDAQRQTLTRARKLLADA